MNSTFKGTCWVNSEKIYVELNLLSYFKKCLFFFFNCQPRNYEFWRLHNAFLYLCFIIKATLSLEATWSLFNGAKWTRNKYINILCIYFNEQYKQNDAVWCSKSAYENAYEFPPIINILQFYTEQFSSVTCSRTHYI